LFLIFLRGSGEIIRNRSLIFRVYPLVNDPRVANTEKIMGPFFPFVETVPVGVICLGLLIARVGRIALIRSSEMGQ
jgi:hypothetical protein